MAEEITLNDTITIDEEDVYTCDVTTGDISINMMDPSAIGGDTITINASDNIYLSSAAGSYMPTWTVANPSSVVLGDTDEEKEKIYICEPWQSKNPIQVEEGLWVSLEKDMISNDELKQKILERLEEKSPETIVKLGINPDNVKLVKSEVNLEINKE